MDPNAKYFETEIAVETQQEYIKFAETIIEKLTAEVEFQNSYI